MKNESHDKRNRWSGFKVRSLITLVLVFSIIIPIPIFSTAAENTETENTETENTETENTASRYSPTVKFDPKGECTLVVTAYDADNTDKNYSDLGDVELVIDLYKVADAKPNVGRDGYYLTVTKSFMGLEDIYKDKDVVYRDKDGELCIKSDITADEWRSLSQEAAKIVLDASKGTAREGVEPDKTSAPGTGEVTIEGLQTGLYLMVAKNPDYYHVTPPEENYVVTTDDGYVVTIKTEYGKEDNIATRVFTDKYRYIFSPELVSLPMNSEFSTANENDQEWIYKVNVNLKPEWENASLKIVKKIDYFVEGSPVTFVFRVMVEVEGRGVISDKPYSIIFDGSMMSDEVKIDGIPVGAKVTVTEAYSGTQYTVTGDVDVTKDIDSNLWYIEFEFENNYDERQTGGHGITNHFTYGEGMWNWEPIENASQE